MANPNTIIPSANEPEPDDDGGLKRYSVTFTVRKTHYYEVIVYAEDADEAQIEAESLDLSECEEGMIAESERDDFDVALAENDESAKPLSELNDEERKRLGITSEPIVESDDEESDDGESAGQ